MRLGISTAISAQKRGGSSPPGIVTGRNIAIWQSRHAIATGTYNDDNANATYGLSKSSWNAKAFCGITQFLFGAAGTQVQFGGALTRIGPAKTLIDWPADVWVRFVLSYSDGSQTVNLPIAIGGSTGFAHLVKGQLWETDVAAALDHLGASYNIPKNTKGTIRWCILGAADGSVNVQMVGDQRCAIPADDQSVVSGRKFNGGETCKYVTTYDSTAMNAFLDTGATQPGTDTLGGGFRPYWITVNYTEAQDSELNLGDSIGVYANDDTNANRWDYGYINRYYNNIRLPSYNLSCHARTLANVESGCNDADYSLDSYEIKHLAKRFAVVRLTLTPNDVSAGVTLANFKARLIKVVKHLNYHAPNTKIVYSIAHPQNTSTDTYATMANQSVAGASAEIAAYYRGEGGATPIADMAAAGATLYRIDDPFGTATAFGNSASTVMMADRPGGVTSGKRYVDEAPLEQYGVFTVSGNGSTTSNMKCDGLVASQDTINATLGMSILWLTGRNAGSSSTIKTIYALAGQTQVLGSAMANIPLTGETFCILYNRAGDNTHPGTAQMYLAAQALAAIPRPVAA